MHYLHNMTRSGSVGTDWTPAEEIKCHILSSQFIAQNTCDFRGIYSS